MARHVEKLELQIERMSKKLSQSKQSKTEKTVVFDKGPKPSSQELSALFIRKPPEASQRRLTKFNENALKFKSQILD